MNREHDHAGLNAVENGGVIQAFVAAVHVAYAIANF